MSYPVQCHAGFPMPLVAGVFEIWGFRATVETTSSEAQIAFFDDARLKIGDRFGNFIPMADIYNTKTLLMDVKGLANTDGNLYCDLAEPIKVRHGISIAADNIKGGSICLYGR